MKHRIFLFSGEGTRGRETELGLVKQSPLWARIEAELAASHGIDLQKRWDTVADRHRCPHSPVLTVASQLCLADLWSRWGYAPEVCIGHSTGELAAAFQAGLYPLEEVLALAVQIGRAASGLEGQMLHGSLSDAQLTALTVNVSSRNFRIADQTHVTVSGYAEELEGFAQQHPAFVKMRLPHPWHHPDYARFADQIQLVESRSVAEGRFLSGATARFETRLPADHWRRWLTEPIDLIAAMQTLSERLGNDPVEIIEIGFHPVLARCCTVLGSATQVSSMCRGHHDARWIVDERRKLDQRPLVQRAEAAVRAIKPHLDSDRALAAQGLDSLDMVELAAVLEPFFPGLSPQDLFRHKSIGALVARFGSRAMDEGEHRLAAGRSPVVISGMSCRFPSSVETVPQFWDMLLSQQDQVRHDPARGRTEAGYLSAQSARFDHAYFGLSAAEARTMDPQQILALELTEMLWRDAGIDPQTLDRRRVGVYLGVWNQEYRGDASSVYAPTGTNPSVVAARISYHYDLRGPSWVSNTACSSSLVAVHYAAKDIEAGRIDYAIAGGVNMLLDERFSTNMRESGFLSADNRCKSFDDAANGYVRAEGGGLVLLSRKSGTERYYAELKGSATNQNGGRAQVITAPHPAAQEEVITDACRDAGVAPPELAYLECHGTGTKLGDPIEISAIQNTVARDRSRPCYLGSVKSNIGHLESASGIAGLIKSVAILNRGIIPPNLHFHVPNRHLNLNPHHLRVVVQQTPIDQQAYCGVSSFGFGGSNAHVVIRGAEAAVRKEIRAVTVPFNRTRAAPLDGYLRLEGQAAAPATPGADGEEPNKQAPDAASAAVLSLERLGTLFDELFHEMTGVRGVLPDVELTDQGLDSLSAVELITKLQRVLNITIEPELLYEFPLRDELVEEIHALAAEGAAAAQVP